MSYSKRTVMATTLLAWGAFLTWMAASGSIARYLGPRTYWVAWFGAVTLLLAGAMTALHAFRSPGAATARADRVGAALLAAPIVFVLALPSPQLGAQAASRKAVGAGALSSFAPPSLSGGPIGLEEIHYAGMSQEYGDQVGIVDGVDVSLTGFVTHPKNEKEGTYSLTRFYISCCAADAVPYSVPVEAGRDLSDDTWLTVTGTLERRNEGFVVVPAKIEEVTEPSSPYLY